MKTLEDFIKENLQKGIIDFSLRANSGENGTSFYIHAANTDSDTLDFDVHGDLLSEKYG